jgi:hypothetical protein
MGIVEKKSALGFGLVVEKFGPITISLVVAACLIWFRPTLLAQMRDNNVQPANLYSAVFNWSAIQVGFAFGVYGFILAKADGFVGAVRKSVAMARFMVYVRRGTTGGFLLTIASIPITAISPDPASSPLCFYALTVWFSLFVWTFLAFIRIAFNFGRLSSVPDREPFFGA